MYAFCIFHINNQQGIFKQIVVRCMKFLETSFFSMRAALMQSTQLHGAIKAECTTVIEHTSLQ
jgi:hypothetical protein